MFELVCAFVSSTQPASYQIYYPARKITNENKPGATERGRRHKVVGRPRACASAFSRAQRALQRHGITLAKDTLDRASCSYALAPLASMRPSRSTQDLRPLIGLCCAALP